MRPWRIPYEQALRPVEAAPDLDAGPYRIEQGWLGALCVHEAAHGVAIVSLGRPLEQIEVGLVFDRDYDGKPRALPRGRCKLKGVTLDAPDIRLSEVPIRQTRQFLGPSYCWRAIIPSTVITCCGPVAELKHRARYDLPRAQLGRSDALPIVWDQRRVWTMAGRDGIAFTRLAWRAAQGFVDDSLIWKAISAVEGELFSGLLRLEPEDPMPGDSVKFVMPGERAEALMREAGMDEDRHIERHSCSPACVRPSRKVSRRWREYMAEWAKETQVAAE